MRALLEEYLDAPTEMVLASDQQAGPQPTLKTMQELFLDADRMGDLKRERLASRDPEMAQKLDLIKKGQADIEKRGLSPRRIEKKRYCRHLFYKEPLQLLTNTQLYFWIGRLFKGIYQFICFGMCIPMPIDRSNLPNRFDCASRKHAFIKPNRVWTIF